NGSDRQQTGPGVLRRGGVGHSGTRAQGEVPSQSHVHLPGQGRPGWTPQRTEASALMVPVASGDISPIYIIQNLMLNQERSMVPGVRDKADANQNRGQVLLLQQTSMVTTPAPPAQPRKKPQTTRVTLGMGRRKPSSFLRIAPHPSKTPPESTSPSLGLQHLSKQLLCPEVKREDPSSAPSSTRLLMATSSPLSSECQTSPSSSSVSHPSPSVLRAAKGLLGTSATSAARYRRFLNTMKVLKQSGLLDITLRTQELMRRSTATEQDIGQLSQHTRLLCQLASSQPGAATGEPSGGPPWERLHQAMAQSGGYPSLKIPQHEPLTPGGCGSDLAATPSSSPSPGLNQNTAASEPSGKVTVMPPDSSTG
ncbi:hypothetical protein CRUP_028078, partial [Coryphaenoides rupestris]